MSDDLEKLFKLAQHDDVEKSCIVLNIIYDCLVKNSLNKHQKERLYKFAIQVSYSDHIRYAWSLNVILDFNLVNKMNLKAAIFNILRSSSLNKNFTMFLENMYSGNFNVNMFINIALNKENVVLLGCIKSICEIFNFKDSIIFENCDQNISLISLAINFLLKTTNIPFYQYYFIDYLANNLEMNDYLILKNLNDAEIKFPYRVIWEFSKYPNNINQCIAIFEEQIDIDLCYILYACYTGLFDNPNIYFEQNLICDVIFDQVKNIK